MSIGSQTRFSKVSIADVGLDATVPFVRDVFLQPIGQRLQVRLGKFEMAISICCRLMMFSKGAPSA